MGFNLVIAFNSTPFFNVYLISAESNRVAHAVSGMVGETATYLVYESKVRSYKVPCSVLNACILWISLKTLCSPALASFADAKLLDFSPNDTQCSIYR
jgi:hypothetical protein